MISNKFLVIIAVGSTLLGCGSKPPIQHTESYSSPRVGTIATRGVGESLVKQETGLLNTDIEIQEDATLGKSVLPKGPYKYSEENAFGIWFRERDQYFYLRKSDNIICIYKTDECGRVAHILEKRLSSLSTDSFQQTLLYNGRIGNRITFGYREFSNNAARPAFSNNVDYDITESTIVGYKGARIEIIKATNTEITYKVLSGFSN
jgi:RNA binding exosome subunit